jgi:hypothetical protein
LGLEAAVTLESNVLGCHVVVECENVSPCVELGESAIAAIESFLATGLAVQVLAREPLLKIVIRRSEFAKAPFSFRVVEELGRPQILVASRDFSPHAMSHDEQRELKARLTDLVVAAFANAFYTPDLEKALEALLRDERATERAVAFTSSFVTVGNVLGHAPSTRVTDWVKKGDARYELKRAVVWDDGDRRAATGPAATTTSVGKPAASGTEVPDELRTLSKSARHSDMKTISLIRERLWNRAGWRGVGVMVPADDRELPVLVFIFTDGTAATEIFEAWREELGATDSRELLSISVVRGISKAAPAHYRVVVGADYAAMLDRDREKVALNISRIHTMEPASTENLDRFLAAFAKAGKYLLVPGVQLNPGEFPRAGIHLAIEKAKLVVRQAWAVGSHDAESVAIKADDDPIIPADQVAPPVLDVLKLARQRGKPE